MTYRNVPRHNHPKGKIDHVPLNRKGYADDCDDPENWRDLEACLQAVEHDPATHNGVGMSLAGVARYSPRPVLVADLDGYKLDPETIEHELVRQLLRSVTSYVEWSPGGGAHVIGFLDDQRVAARIGSSRQGLLNGTVDLFHTTRFVTMTFRPFPAPMPSAGLGQGPLWPTEPPTRDHEMTDMSEAVATMLLDPHERLRGALPDNLELSTGSGQSFILPEPLDTRPLDEVIAQLHRRQPYDETDLQQHLYIRTADVRSRDLTPMHILNARDEALRQLLERKGYDRSAADMAIASSVATVTNNVQHFCKS